MTALIVTSIHGPNPAMRALAAGCVDNGWSFFVAGDSKSPSSYDLPGCCFLSLEEQRRSGFRLAELAPEKTYTRKNIAYLTALASGARKIVETDDDNHPYPGFWKSRDCEIECRSVRLDGWVNAYRYFSETFIYPRGLPLRRARDVVPPASVLQTRNCPIQQGLADQDPDVDAVYRMLFELPLVFSSGIDNILLDAGTWCPFNSQNTTFFDHALPLLYLPAHCSFRMTDIWRSFIAQRVLHHRGEGVLFHGPTVWQERNEHDLQCDFRDELPGYLHNERIREELIALSFKDRESTQLMVEKCYQTLIRNGWIAAEEEELLAAWFHDLKFLGLIAS